MAACNTADADKLEDSINHGENHGGNRARDGKTVN
jgi:hypothetical protein